LEKRILITISVKILGYKFSQRYPIRRMLIQAQKAFERDRPDVHLDIQEVGHTEEILHYTPVIAFPSLMIGENLVCTGRSPDQSEIMVWLENEVLKKN
jgi:hypothetical protein